MVFDAPYVLLKTWPLVVQDVDNAKVAFLESSVWMMEDFFKVGHLSFDLLIIPSTRNFLVE